MHLVRVDLSSYSSIFNDSEDESIDWNKNLMYADFTELE